MNLIWPSIAAGMTVGAAGVYGALRRKNMHLWLPGTVFSSNDGGRSLADDGLQHVYIAICDHFEPQWGRPEKSIAIERVERWRREYPVQFDRFRDCNGRPPQHTFFFPADEYQPEYLDTLAELCRAGYGDVDVHLHHDHDTAEGLHETLLNFTTTLHKRHGLLRRNPDSGQVVYGFIHGNWALCNSRPDGRWCGVNEEIDILRDTGCYADFTMPSAPSDTQTSTVNSVYYAKNVPGRAKSHDRGVLARVGQVPPKESLLLIQGPLLLNWHSRKWGLIPRIENSDLTAANPPTRKRFQLWRNANVHVTGAPGHLFVKLHTHGCKPSNSDMWLGGAAAKFHAELAREAERDSRFRFHYVSAWEMAQRVHELEQSVTVSATDRMPVLKLSAVEEKVPCSSP